jgi:hypothetical protein
MGPRQINKEYYNQIQLSVFGIGIFFFDDIQKKIKLLNVDVVADVDEISPNAISAIRCLRLLRQQDFFKIIDKNEYIFWADCGTHFRCAEFCHFLFDELAESDIRVNLNFFAEKHGKSGRDQHFSALSKYIEQENNVNKISDIDSLVKCLKVRQELTNSNRKNLRQDPILLEVLRFPPKLTNQKIKRNFREIADISCYYNLQNIRSGQGFELKSSIFSDLDKLLSIQSIYDHEKILSIKAKKDNQPAQLGISIDYLKNKRIFLEFLQLESSQDENLQPGVVNGNKPKFCEEKCKNCNSKCTFSIFDLNNNKKINQAKIQTELKNHYHPSSRLIKKNIQRSTEQARLELIEHYKYKHNI